MLIDGPDDLVRDAMERLEVICDAYLSVSTPVQVAAPQLIEAGALVRAQILDRVRSNYRALRTAAARHPAIEVLQADAGWSAVLRVPSTRSEEDLVVDLLEPRRRARAPGVLLRLRSRSLHHRQPASRAAGVCRRNRPGAGASRCVIVAPGDTTTDATPACWCRSSPFRRGGAGASARFPISCRSRAGSRMRASTSCSFCRSTRCRTGRARRIRR